MSKVEGSTKTAPYPHPAGGFAFGVINDKLYTAGGRDAANLIINDTWEYDPVANAYTQKADEPAQYQNNVPGSGAALDALWVFGGATRLPLGLAQTRLQQRLLFSSSLFKALRGRGSHLPTTRLDSMTPPRTPGHPFPI